MCRTFTITYLLCLHPKTETKPCLRRRGILSHFRSRCENIKTEFDVYDFCPECRIFWDWHFITTKKRREMVADFRVANAYHGPLSPILKSGGDVTFRTEEESQMSGRNAERIVAANQMDDDITRLSMLNAAAWVLKDDEAPLPAGSTRPRRGSTSSAVTIWPCAKDMEDIMLESNEFGNKVDMEHLRSPQAAHLPREGLVDPEFELVNLGEEVSVPVNGEGFEQQRLTRSIAPLPNALPHRSPDEHVLTESYFSST